MNQIAQIIPYFGKWPKWIGLYLYSCGRNPMIDFIFYTDCDITGLPIYANIRFESMTLNDYCKLVGERLNINYKIENAYKLTDLKPFLGYIHKLELAQYKFWSFGDLDLCYGDLSMLLNERNLKRYDLLTTHCYHIAGHFTVLRNNDYYRELCFKIGSWETRLTDNKHYGFDENEWSALVYPGLYWGRLIWKFVIRRSRVTDFILFMNLYNGIFNRKHLFHEYYTSLAPKPQQQWRYDVDNAKIFDYNGRELPYLHFLFFKKTPWLETEDYWREGYYKLDQPISDYAEIRISLNGIHGIYYK
ncbi:MAG: hypothetical protein K2J00_07840 [Bacteroidaceae bacterium]|nr:hypothetical protein [Bacteroidaceae bacterium]